MFVLLCIVVKIMMLLRCCRIGLCQSLSFIEISSTLARLHWFAVSRFPDGAGGANVMIPLAFLLLDVHAVVSKFGKIET